MKVFRNLILAAAFLSISALGSAQDPGIINYIPISSLPFTDNNSLSSTSDVSLSLRYGSYVVAYSLDLTAGDRIEITLCSDDFDSYLYLVDTDYYVVAENDDGWSNSSCSAFYGELIRQLIPATGTYYIVATSHGASQTGNFTLNVKMLLPKILYVDAVGGDDTNDGKTPSTAFASLQEAINLLNDEFSSGTVYVMSDILLEDMLSLDCYLSLLPYNNGTYTITRNINSCQYQMFEVSHYAFFWLGEPGMSGSLIIDGGYESVNSYYSSGPIILNYGTLEMHPGITLQNNRYAGGDGGAIANYATLNIYGGKISNNEASQGGGIYNYSANIVLYDGEITNNHANFNGGGIYDEWGASFVINGGTISHNTADGRGEAIYTSAFILHLN